MSDWMRIGNGLPTAGVTVLAYYLNRAGNGRIVCAVLALPKMFRADDGEDLWWDEEDGEYYAPPGWYEIADNAEDGGLWPIMPSHWQPLPAPPT